MDSRLPYIDITLLSNVHIVHVGPEYNHGMLQPSARSLWNFETHLSKSSILDGVEGSKGERTPLNW